MKNFQANTTAAGIKQKGVFYIILKKQENVDWKFDWQYIDNKVSKAKDYSS